MVSIAEVMSMAMARLLVVILKVRRRYGRTCNYAVSSREKKIDVEEQVQLFGWNRLTDGKDDGLHIDEVKDHHVKVGVGVLPNREGRRCYSGL